MTNPTLRPCAERLGLSNGCGTGVFVRCVCESFSIARMEIRCGVQRAQTGATLYFTAFGPASFSQLLPCRGLSSLITFGPFCKELIDRRSWPRCVHAAFLFRVLRRRPSLGSRTQSAMQLTTQSFAAFSHNTVIRVYD